MPLRLLFDDPELEREYQVSFARAWRTYYQAGSVLLPVLFAVFVLVDWIVIPERFAVMTLVRCGVVVPLLTACLPLYWSRSLVPHYERRLQRWLLLEAVVAYGGLLVLGALAVPVAGRTWIEASLVGNLIAVAFVYVSRMDFRSAAAISVGGTLTALSLLFTSPDWDGEILLIAVFFGLATNAIGMWIAWTLERDMRRDFLRARELALARQRTEDLLRMVLPVQITERMRHTQGRTFAEPHPEVTVVLADIAGFTPLCERLAPMELGALLDAVFSRFDELCDRHGVLKIKTLGDGWLAAAGVPDPRPDHAEAAVALAADMQRVVAAVREETGHPIGLRIGVCTGPVVAGVIGRTRYAYDLWGEAVRGAVRMEQGGARDRVRLAPSTAERLPPGRVSAEGDAIFLRQEP